MGPETGPGGAKSPFLGPGALRTLRAGEGLYDATCGRSTIVILTLSTYDEAVITDL